jgi:alanyl-tRNA synthetase
LRSALKEFRKKLDDLEKAGKANIVQKVVEETKKFLVETPPAEPYLVRVLQAESNTKALDAALKQVKALSPATSAMFLTVDTTAGKVFCLSNVPPAGVTKGLKANEWIAKVAEVRWRIRIGRPKSN